MPILAPSKSHIGNNSYKQAGSRHSPKTRPISLSLEVDDGLAFSSFPMELLLRRADSTGNAELHMAGNRASPTSHCLVNTDKIDQHHLRKEGRIVGRTRPIPANGHIEQQKERMCKGPRHSFRKLCRRNLGIESIIHVPADTLRLPVDRKNMEFVLQRLPARQRILSPSTISSRITGPMNGAMYDIRLSADIFHNIDLTAHRPADFAKIFSKHPERGPDALPERELYASLHQTIGKRKFSARNQTCGGNAAGPCQHERLPGSTSVTVRAVRARQLFPSSDAFSV